MPAIKDLTGQKFFRLTVIEQAPRGNCGQIRWLCKCDCGNEKIVNGQSLRNGSIKSCGCYHKEIASITGTKNCTKHGKSKTRLYGVWMAVKRRCYNKNDIRYSYYGRRGITVCDEWRSSYEAFEKWALEHGYDENAQRGKCTIDRIDVNGNYEPSNCRWVDNKTQTRNQRTNHIVEYQGEKMPIAELAERTGIPYSRLQPRITALGWDAEKAVNTPFKQKGA